MEPAEEHELLLGAAVGTAAGTAPERLPLSQPAGAEHRADEQGSRHENEVNDRDGDGHDGHGQPGTKREPRAFQPVGRVENADFHEGGAGFRSGAPEREFEGTGLHAELYGGQ